MQLTGRNLAQTSDVQQGAYRDTASNISPITTEDPNSRLSLASHSKHSRCYQQASCTMTLKGQE